MAKVAVLLAQGYEEGESITIVDLLRRAGIKCDTMSFGEDFVKGMHGMWVKADRLFDEKALEAYDGLVLPGGRPGGANLRANPRVIEQVQKFNREGKLVAAMCSGTLVLTEADIIKGRRVTGYTGYAEKMEGAVFLDDVVVTDGNLVTSQGPATCYPFAFQIAEWFGKTQEVQTLKERLMYTFAKGK